MKNAIISITAGLLLSLGAVNNASASSNKAPGACYTGPEAASAETISGMVKCGANAAVVSTALYNLYKVGSNAGKAPEDRSEIEHSIVKTYHESVCLGDFSDSVFQSLIKTQNAADHITRDQGLAAFLSSVWELQKKRVKGKTWRKDFIPKLAGKGFGAVAKATTGEDTVLKDLTAPVEVMTKYSLNQNVSEKEKAKDQQDIMKKLRCGKVVSKVIDGATGDKRSVLTGVLNATKGINSFQSKAGDYLMYVDMATLLAMNGGAMGEQLIQETIAPGVDAMKNWTLSQKAKAAAMGLKMRNLFSRMKDNSLVSKDSLLDRVDAGTELIPQTQKALSQKLEKANREYDELNRLVNEVVAEGDDELAPKSIRDYATHLQLYWAQVRHKRETQVALLKEKTRRLLCQSPDKALNAEQLEEKHQTCSADDMKQKEPLLQRAKNKAKSLWNKFKNRNN